MAIKRQHYQIPSAQEFFSRIGKAKYFSTYDATSGFLQVPLAEDSTSLTTMAICRLEGTSFFVFLLVVFKS